MHLCDRCTVKPAPRPDVRVLYLVVFTEELHPDHSEDENDDGEDECQVPQGAHRVTDDLDQGVEGWP